LGPSAAQAAAVGLPLASRPSSVRLGVVIAARDASGVDELAMRIIRASGSGMP
jgi:uncharacterized protein (DUF362 family)